MEFEQGSFTKTSTGTETIVLDGSFTPVGFIFEMGPRTSTTETLVTKSNGSHDVANSRKKAYSVFDDGTIRRTIETTSYCITHYKNVSGTFTKIFSGNVVSVAPGEFDFNADVADADDYTIRFIAFG